MRRHFLVLLAILILALLLRLIGLNWDDHSHLHPDERFLTGMASAIGEAHSLTTATNERCHGSGKYDYFNTSCSVYNPNNVADGSYAYGTLPLFMVRLAAQGVAELSDDDIWLTYDYIHFVGRAVNAVADVLTTLFVFLIGWRLFSVRHGLIAAFLYACAVLPIQLSHYWTVDIISNLFFVIGLYALIEISKTGRFWWYAIFGAALGSAVASRINFAPFALMLLVAVFIYLQNLRGAVTRRGWLIRAWIAVLGIALAGILAFFTFRVFQPYTFMGPTFSEWGDLNDKWLEDIRYVSNLSSNPDDGWPPSNQWFGRVKYLYPYWNLMVWGLGAPLGIAATLGLAWVIYQQLRSRRLSVTFGVMTLWVVLYFAWQGGLHQMTMRYYLPLYGILCVLATWILLRLNWPARKYITAGVLLATLLWAFAFTRVYRQPLTRLEASEWVVENFPTTLTFEDKNGRRYPAELLSGALNFPLTTVVNGETYISEGFHLNDFIVLNSFEMTFADTAPSTVNLRLLYEDDPFAERPIAQFTVQTNGEPTIHYDLLDQIPPLPEGTYNWHFDVQWQGDEPYRYVMPTYQWSDAEGFFTNTPMDFLSPYDSVEFAALGDGIELKVKADAPLVGFHIPHYIGQAIDLTLRMGENEVVARPIEASRERHVLGAEWYYEFDEPLQLNPDENYTLRGDLSAYIAGTVIVTEGAWDDHVPWGFCRQQEYHNFIRLMEDCDRIDPFAAGYYSWLELNMAETDTSTKGLRMSDILYKGDYLTISSNRFYDALPRYPIHEPHPRIPNRFILSTRFYNDLFGGNLDYELLRKFTSFPGLLGFDFPDQVLPTTNLPKFLNELEAEEAFTVYDHPTVFIFRNEGFDKQNLSTTLIEEDKRNKIDLADYDSTFSPPQERATPQDVQNALMRWFVGFLLLGWAAYPMTFLLFAGLPLRGFGIGRGVGWLSLTLVSWWLTATTGGDFWTRDALWVFVSIFMILNGMVAFLYRAELFAYIRQNFTAILAIELLFIIAFAFGVYLRAVDPDLWHEARGGEKPMDFAYLNATLRTSDFPPPNPWLAGYEINYYYFGFVLAALPIKLGNIPPEIGFNLVLAVLYAVVAVNVFTLAYALLGYAETLIPRFRLRAALLGAAFIMLAGNLATIYRIVEPEADITHPHRWYWYPTRVIAESENGARNGGPITEMPLFSFLFGDPHAHVYALLPVTLYLLLLWLMVTQKRLWIGVLLGMVSGVIFMSNIWDILLYVPLGILAVWFATRDVRKFVQLGALVVVGGLLTIAPYYVEFSAGGNRGFETWKEESSLFQPFMITWGIPIGVLSIWLLYRLKAVLVPDADSPVEIGILLITVAILYFVGGDQQKASVISAMLSFVALVLARFDAKHLRPIHFFISLIFAILLWTEHYVIKGDVGRLNTVFKLAFQLWIWLGLLMVLTLYIMWTSYRLKFQVIACLVLMALGFLYPVKAVPGREIDNESGQLTLDGYKFTETLRLNTHGLHTYTIRDNNLTRWMRANIEGFPVIAEWYTAEYTWNNRVAVQTGLPSVMGWANHMRQQYQHLHPEIDSRITDIYFLYTTRSPEQVREIIRKYDIEYIVIGIQERANMQPETLDIFYDMLHNGELSLAYDAPFTELFKVENLQES